MPVAKTSCQIEVKEPNGGDANLSENNTAKLMYYRGIILNVCIRM